MRCNGRIRFTFTNVFVTVALFAALCGTSYAALRVTGKQIKNESITGKDVKNFSLAKGDLRKGLLESTKATPLNSAAYQAERDAGPAGVAPGDFVTVATLNVAPGPYVVNAKTNLTSADLDVGRCQLVAGAKGDSVTRGLRSNGTAEALNMQAATTFPGPGAITVACKTTDSAWSATDTKILAVKVDSEQG
jgi:hypothetical protein